MSGKKSKEVLSKTHVRLIRAIKRNSGLLDNILWIPKEFENINTAIDEFIKRSFAFYYKCFNIEKEKINLIRCYLVYSANNGFFSRNKPVDLSIGDENVTIVFKELMPCVARGSQKFYTFQYHFKKFFIKLTKHFYFNRKNVVTMKKYKKLLDDLMDCSNPASDFFDEDEDIAFDDIYDESDIAFAVYNILSVDKRTALFRSVERFDKTQLKKATTIKSYVNPISSKSLKEVKSHLLPTKVHPTRFKFCCSIQKGVSLRKVQLPVRPNVVIKEDFCRRVYKQNRKIRKRLAIIAYKESQKVKDDALCKINYAMLKYLKRRRYNKMLEHKRKIEEDERLAEEAARNRFNVVRPSKMSNHEKKEKRISLFKRRLINKDSEETFRRVECGDHSCDSANGLMTYYNETYKNKMFSKTKVKLCSECRDKPRRQMHYLALMLYRKRKLKV